MRGQVRAEAFEPVADDGVAAILQRAEQRAEPLGASAFGVPTHLVGDDLVRALDVGPGLRRGAARVELNPSEPASSRIA
jgi:hypothetical protein